MRPDLSSLVSRAGCSRRTETVRTLAVGVGLLLGLGAGPRAVADGLLIDFGSPDSLSGVAVGGQPVHWNNVTASVGVSEGAELAGLVDVDGAEVPLVLQIVSRFNGANESGTASAGPHPGSATRDSLFGNTELFSGLENVTPVFMLTGLNPAVDYALDFYVSRMGVSDNRETRYEVVGAANHGAELNAANNESEMASVSGVRPDAAGSITVSLLPGANNDNGNHFTYLGVMRVSWTAGPAAGPATLDQPALAAGTFRFRLTGTAGATYRVLGSGDLRQWSDVRSVSLTGASTLLELPAPEAFRFYQAVAVP